MIPRGFCIVLLVSIVRSQINLNTVVDRYTELFQRIEKDSNVDSENLSDLSESADLKDGRRRLEFHLTNGILSGLSDLERGGNFTASLIPRIYVKGIIHIPKLTAQYDYSVTVSGNRNYGTLELTLIDVDANLTSGFNFLTSSIQNADIKIVRVGERSSKLTSASSDKAVDLDSTKIDHLLYVTGMAKAIEKSMAKYIEKTSGEVNREFIPILVQNIASGGSL